ncbi:MAG TPA: hypothetical protein VE826_13380, partial [Dongiaceae bacterium]|nr:hypothetical protein [Dongiaceae bacterium]
AEVLDAGVADPRAVLVAPALLFDRFTFHGCCVPRTAGCEARPLRRRTVARSVMSLLVAFPVPATFFADS